jgi:hypothetical protein
MARALRLHREPIVDREHALLQATEHRRQLARLGGELAGAVLDFALEALVEGDVADRNPRLRGDEPKGFDAFGAEGKRGRVVLDV